MQESNGSDVKILVGWVFGQKRNALAVVGEDVNPKKQGRTWILRSWDF
jgi:hypothetical protein